MLSKQIIDQMVANQKQRPKTYMVAQPFSNFAPLQYSQSPIVDPSTNATLMQSIGQVGATRGDMAEEASANKKLFTALQGVNKKVRTLQSQIQGVSHGNFTPSTPHQPRSQTGKRDTEGGKWGSTPEVSDIRKLRPHAPLTTLNFHGIDYTVNSQVAPIFQSFLRDLWKSGYHPAVIQGYNKRNIAGTDTTSLHSYGFAIDIDPAKNPVQDAGQHMQTSLPPRVRTLANKYGLAWGGTWHSYKDPMHFSVPYDKTE